MTVVLEARDLTVAYCQGGDTRTALAGVSLALEAGRIVGLAGESGAGKSTLALAMAGFFSPGAAAAGGAVDFAGTDLVRADLATRRRLWGTEIAYLPQDCSTALNPALRIGGQLDEVLRVRSGLAANAARTRALELLERVELNDPERLLARYPHELSGGEQQRVALALAIACDPRALLLDEPTTGLDNRTQRNVLKLLARLVRERGTAVLLVGHDLPLLAEECDEIVVMYAGRVVERGVAADVLSEPGHPYTAALVAALPTLAAAHPPRGLPGTAPLEPPDHRCGFAERCSLLTDDCLRPIELVATTAGRQVRCVRTEADRRRVLPRLREDHAQEALRSRRPVDGGERVLVRVAELRCGYGDDVALDGVSFELAEGRALGVAGESGAGKSTLLRAIAGLRAPLAGRVELDGVLLAPSVSARSREQLAAIQIVFQNPDSTLNPRHSVAFALGRALKLFRPDLSATGRRSAAAAALERVELPARLLARLPHELSSGQRQRVAIARALVAQPRLLLCDEPTSALDVSAQATVLELLRALRDRDGLAIVFVSHDLGVLRHVADELLVLERGVVREQGPTLDLLRHPRHPYTAELIAAVPRPPVALR